MKGPQGTYTQHGEPSPWAGSRGADSAFLEAGGGRVLEAGPPPGAGGGWRQGGGGRPRGGSVSPAPSDPEKKAPPPPPPQAIPPRVRSQQADRTVRAAATLLGKRGPGAAALRCPIRVPVTGCAPL